MTFSNYFNKFLLIAFMTSNSSVIGMNHSDLFENKNILVLGGTGYLGRAIVTEVLKYNPRSVTILSRDEVKIFYTTQLFKNNSKVHGVIGDIRDYECMLKATRSIDIVFHVAALKRMDMLESNIEEAIKTNVLGTINVFNACIVNDVSKVLFISTDKASLPINAYGACKFISEKIFTNYDTTKIKTKFIATRFGNILESTGSVIPIFTEKINKGEDIPLTDEKMTRFIVSKEEAVELMFNALRYGIGGEIFVRRLPALRVIDLIEVLKTQYNGQNKIKLIGLRPGEKIHEVLINEFEMARTYVFDNYFVITPSFSYWLPSDFLDEEDVPQYIKRGRKVETALMHNYSSSEEVVSRDELAKTFVRLGLFQ